MYYNVEKKKFVAPVDVLMDLNILSKKDYEGWRNGKIEYLEKVCKVNLKKLNGILTEMRNYANENNLKSSWTYYHRWGKNKKQKLRFSKSNNEHMENFYATHYVMKEELNEDLVCRKFRRTANDGKIMLM